MLSITNISGIVTVYVDDKKVWQGSISEWSKAVGNARNK